MEGEDSIDSFKKQRERQRKIEFNRKDNSKYINMVLFGLSQSNRIRLNSYTLCVKGIPIENQSSLCKCNWSYLNLDTNTQTRYKSIQTHRHMNNTQKIVYQNWSNFHWDFIVCKHLCKHSINTMAYKTHIISC